jgi:CRP-like cAMP-binding protein
MKVKLGEAKAEARALYRAGDYARALRAYERLLEAMPLDYEMRFRIGDILAKTGLSDEAAEVYRTVAVHDIRSGHPLPAVVASYALEKLGQKADDILGLLARTYASGSPQLARFAVRPAPVDPETLLEVREPSESEPFDKLAERASRCALDLSAFVTYQQQFHPLPFLSELGAESMLAVLKSLSVKRLDDGAAVMRQGERGTSLFLVAAGELRVFTTAADGAERELARLFENTLFGEMALITDQPRAASVAVVDEADVIEVNRDALGRITAQIPVVQEVLDRFARERLIKNLLATSPLFTPFTKPQQADLLRRFEGVEVNAGTDVISQGEPGQGLYVVLSGELEVVTQAAAGAPVVLGRLGTGDIFGEMSLLSSQPTSATVRASSKCNLLFLAGTYVERLSAAIPEVKSYFATVATRRAQDNTLRLGAAALPEEPLELDASDVILL